MKLLGFVGGAALLLVAGVTLFLQSGASQHLIAPASGGGTTTVAVAAIPQVAQRSDTTSTFQPLLLEAKIALEQGGGSLDQASLVAQLASAEPEARIGQPDGVSVRVLADGHSVLLCAPAGGGVHCQADDLVSGRSGSGDGVHAAQAAAQARAALAVS